MLHTSHHNIIFQIIIIVLHNVLSSFLFSFQHSIGLRVYVIEKEKTLGLGKQRTNTFGLLSILRIPTAYYIIHTCKWLNVWWNGNEYQSSGYSFYAEKCIPIRWLNDLKRYLIKVRLFNGIPWTNFFEKKKNIKIFYQQIFLDWSFFFFRKLISLTVFTINYEKIIIKKNFF